MAKHQTNTAIEHESGRGVIKDNALKAIVTSSLFRTRTEKPKKGKGSYNRKQKGQKLKGLAPFDSLALALLLSKHNDLTA